MMVRVSPLGEETVVVVRVELVQQAPALSRDMQATDWACFLTRLRAGIRMDISSAMMAITTNSSMSVKPFLRPVMTIPFSAQCW